MILAALDIPEFGPARDALFDEQLAGGKLPELVAELLALLDLPLDRPESLPAVNNWLGARREAFLAGGVSALDESQRRDLTRYPWLLLDLQAEIDMEGGDHWVDVAMRSPEFAAAVAQSRRDLEKMLNANVVAAGSIERTSEQRGASRQKVWAIAALAAIAAALALVWAGGRAFLPPTPPPAGGWGWNQQDLLAGSPTPAEYLNRLADAGAKWRNKRPETKADVGQRIRELRAGCQRLIDGDHPPLSVDQQAALKALCRKWAGQFDQVLVDLDAGRQTPLEARTAIDEIVDKLVGRLRSGPMGLSPAAKG